jgi:pimeloyl-ACP methyl ester carboxylesterase
MNKSELSLWRRARTPHQDRADRAIVFVHGIFSNHKTFQSFFDRLIVDHRFADFDIFYFDYDYHDALENNGHALATSLMSTFLPSDRVELIAHSMGGLVARLAALSNRMAFVRSLFLLGTPNVGAIRIAQVSLLAQLILGTFNVAFAIFPRKRGIVDLTRAAEILRRNETNAYYTDHIDYISIPGLFYHEGRSYWEIGRDRWKKLFSIFRLGLGFLEATFPLFAVKLLVPHDGIVEETSNNLIPSTAGRKSEKNDSINKADTDRITYAHIEIDSCDSLNHVQLHSDKDVYDTVTEIILFPLSRDVSDRLESRLVAWWRGLEGESNRRITRIKFK